MYKVTPEKQEDGKETVNLYGTIVDVTDKSEFTLFKRDYEVVRETKDKKTDTKSKKKAKADTEAQES